MDYEKKYKEALERARNLHKDAIDMGESLRAKQCEIIFSELKESGTEDEKIRKELISHFVGLRDNISKEWYGIKVDDIIAWLEKQGKNNMGISEATKQELEDNLNKALEKETPESLNEFLEKQGESKFEQCVQEGDKIVTNEDGTHFNVSQLERVAKKEPKFKVGDYLVNDYCKGKVIALTDDAYLLDTEQGIPFSYEHNAHLWTIQDAKDGDVLCGYPKSDYPWIGIFYKLNAKGTFNSYCYLQAGLHGKFCTPSGKNICGERNTDNHSSKDVIPATTEQRETLFKAMREAGYEWDAEKKELKKIEIITPLFNVGDTIIKKHNSDINDFGQFTITDITGGKYWYNDRIICDITEQDKWELYEPVRQNSAWSEGDENMLKSIIATCELAEQDRDSSPARHLFEMQSNWLKSIKDRIQPSWKPEDIHLEALRCAINGNNLDVIALKDLLEQLKRL